ncbi:MAG TPA: ScpA family protein [Solirubrobacteraceae bacterium]|nr:ScpA family protein [Solirubrobacteraceae bacterium]
MVLSSQRAPDHRGGDRDDRRDDGPGGDTAARAGYHVRIDAFEGPFDLLLQLIARRRLDVSDIGLAEITADFLSHLRDLGVHDLDLDTATSFLVVAATLVELKAARLLPTDGHDELTELLNEARDVLYARLLEYRAIRDASRRLQALFAANAGAVPRRAALEPELRALVPPTVLGTDAPGLATLAAAALAPRPAPTVALEHLHRALLSVHEASQRLLARVAAGDTLFDDVVHGMSRGEVIAHFLAALELYKAGRVDLRQPARFGALLLSPRSAGPVALPPAAEASSAPPEVAWSG